jgi:hypothetical protein
MMRFSLVCRCALTLSLKRAFPQMTIGCVALGANAQMTDVLTYHNDNARTGQALHEEILSPANVSTNHFGKLWVLPVDGKVDAEPLYAAGIKVPGIGARNVLLVVTENDTAYAFDADSTNKLWQVSMLATGERPSDSRNCSQVAPVIGITGTPVIDRNLGASGTLFLVAMSTDGTNYFHRVHALDLGTGADRVPPVTVAATYPGTGDGSSGGVVIFNPAQYKERPGLLMLDGVVYTSWGSHCDNPPYTGWVIAYDEQTLAQVSVLDITPNGSEGGIWMSGGALAADPQSNIYFLAGNGTFDTTLTTNGFPTQNDFGNGFIKLSTSDRSLAVVDYFATFETPTQNSQDADLGSGGPLLLPDMTDSQGATRHLAVGAGKDSNLYLVDRSNMGKFNSTNDNAIYQKLPGALPAGIFSSPAYFNGTLYYGSVGHSIQAFPFQSAMLLAPSSHTAQTFVYPGATPGISANVSSNGIVWAVENASPNAVLRAYNPANLSVEFYDSNQAGSRDHFGDGNKFITPMIASARVYVGTPNGVGVLGLLDQTTLTPLQKWRDDHFRNPSNVGAGANASDPAGDGVANLLKYALGLDPLTSTVPSQVISGSLDQTNGQTYAVLRVQRAAIVPDVTYTIEVSSNLQNWASGPSSTTTLVDSASGLIVRDNTALGSSPRFMRLRVTSP